MGHAIFDFLRSFIADYGYWAIAIALLCENAGIPVPGETTLLLASFLAYSEHKLDLGWIIVVATIAAIIGDNIGFALGHFGGRPLLDRYRSFFRISPAAVEHGEKLFARFGASTVFLARFIFGLRIFAGPLAGVLRMHWKTFVLFNFLGAMVWVSAIATVGYLFGQHWDNLEHVLGRFNLVVAIAALILIPFVWRRYHRALDKNR